MSHDDSKWWSTVWNKLSNKISWSSILHPLIKLIVGDLKMVHGLVNGISCVKLPDNIQASQGARLRNSQLVFLYTSTILDLVALITTNELLVQFNRLISFLENHAFHCWPQWKVCWSKIRRIGRQGNLKMFAYHFVPKNQHKRCSCGSCSVWGREFAQSCI